MKERPGVVAAMTRTALPVAVAALVLTDLVGGLIAVATDVNTWADAWGGHALLAAPLPMVAAQVLLTWLALRLPARWAAAARGPARGGLPGERGVRLLRRRAGARQPLARPWPPSRCCCWR